MKCKLHQPKDRGKATVETSLNAESADKDASEWKEMTDKTSGRKFYYNVNTKKTQWNKPLEVPSKPALIAAQKEAIVPQSTTPAKQDQKVALTSSWTKRKDKKSGRYFYYNSETKKTQWETPVDFVENSAVEEKSDKTSAIDPISEAPKNDKNQKKKKKKEKKKKEEDNLKSNEAQSSGSSLSDWTEKTDKTSGRVFYYNKKTKKTQWTKPVESSSPMDLASSTGLGTSGTEISPTTGAIATSKDESEKLSNKSFG